ncbi:rhamnosyl transferase [Sulfuriferula multivorans]|uniref:Rhamnosyl transferase n=1 Tax=Sulfuriferula multivorans TaxID=1559896 RepID=A0A401JGT5_9PROT|nr:glycosyltransferase family 2 protein [Sulfuriferula multivorans]GBL46835.1 rhamnosyl transferase [Sulfuriferula multivorans]
MNPHVAVVILNWNGWQDTLQCLDSLALQRYPNASLIVVDNASTDGSKDRIVKWSDNGGKEWVRRQFVIDASAPERLSLDVLSHGDFVYIQSEVNGGFAAGNNLGIRVALEYQAIYVWVLNNDTEVHPSALDALVMRAEEDPAIGMCGSILIYHDSRSQIQACGGVSFNHWRAKGKQVGHGLDPDSAQLSAALRTPLSYIAGASLLARSKMILDIGVIEERYFLYFEEIDWSMRAKSWKLAVAPNSIVFHKEGASIGTASRGRRSALSQYYLNRNVLLFYARFHKLLLPIAIARVVRELLHQLKKRDRKLLHATWRALIDGMLLRNGRIDLE